MQLAIALIKLSFYLYILLIHIMTMKAKEPPMTIDDVTYPTTSVNANTKDIPSKQSHITG
jgi:hypothetical protein